MCHNDKYLRNDNTKENKHFFVMIRDIKTIRVILINLSGYILMENLFGSIILHFYVYFFNNSLDVRMKFSFKRLRKKEYKTYNYFEHNQ